MITHTERVIAPDGTVTIREVFDDGKMVVNRKDKLGGGEFIFLFQKAVMDIVQSGVLGKNEYRVLLYLMAKTEFEKEINITQYSIAKEIGMQQTATQKALSNLSKINILIRDTSLRSLRLNYEIGFKGSPTNYKKVQYDDNPILEIQQSKQTSITDKDQQVNK